MADTDKPSETVTQGDSQTTVTTTTTPPAPEPKDNGVDQAEVARLRKEAEQEKMRANQLANKLADKEKAEEEARQKRLAEDNNHKELFEQEKAKREALEADKEARERQAELTEAKTKVLSEFSEDVKTAAEDLGLELPSAEEADVEQFKGKLEKLSQKISSAAEVTPNNPGQPGGKTELTTDQLREGLRDDKSFHDIVTDRFPGIKAMTSKPKIP